MKFIMLLDEQSRLISVKIDAIDVIIRQHTPNTMRPHKLILRNGYEVFVGEKDLEIIGEQLKERF